MKTIYDISNLIKCEDDIDVVISVLGLDIDMSKEAIIEHLYTNDNLIHEAIETIMPDIDKIHSIGDNLRVLHNIHNRLITERK